MDVINPFKILQPKQVVCCWEITELQIFNLHFCFHFIISSGKKWASMFLVRADPRNANRKSLTVSAQSDNPNEGF